MILHDALQFDMVHKSNSCDRRIDTEKNASETGEMREKSNKQKAHMKMRLVGQS